MFELKGHRIAVLGHRGLVGSAILKRLRTTDCQIVIAKRHDCDLRRQDETEGLFAKHRPDVVFLAAATVGGIAANSEQPGTFGYDNMAINLNVIEAARRFDVEKLINLGSSCIYPRDAAQPIVEEALMTGPLEPSNSAYATAKIAAIALCNAYRAQYGCDFITVMPPNIYGENDHFEGRNTHVMGALISRIVAAKREGSRSITIWGTGRPVREFLHADDCADALVFLAERYSSDMPINVGTGLGISILDLAHMIARYAGWTGEIHTDETMPDGHPVKVMDVRRMAKLGWQPSITLEGGVRRTIEAYEARLP